MGVQSRPTSRKPASRLPAVLSLGMVCQIGQIVLLRELLMVFHGSELSIGVIFAALMVGTTPQGQVNWNLGANVSGDPGTVAYRTDGGEWVFFDNQRNVSAFRAVSVYL